MLGLKHLADYNYMLYYFVPVFIFCLYLSFCFPLLFFCSKMGLWVFRQRVMVLDIWSVQPLVLENNNKIRNSHFDSEEKFLYGSFLLSPKLLLKSRFLKFKYITDQISVFKVKSYRKLCSTIEYYDVCHLYIPILEDPCSYLPRFGVQRSETLRLRSAYTRGTHS